MDRTGGISTVGGGKVVITEEEMGRGDRAGKLRLLGNRVYSGSQSLVHSVGRKRQEVHLGWQCWMVV